MAATPQYVTTKTAQVGDLLARAKSAGRKAEPAPAEYRRIASIEVSTQSKTFTFEDGTAYQCGAATKVWLVKADAPAPAKGKPASPAAKQAAEHSAKAADTKARQQQADAERDAADARIAEAKAAPQAAKAAPAAAGKPAIYLEALAAKKAGKRGPGVKLSDDDLVGTIVALREAHPDCTQAQLLEVAYWLERLAVSRGRWNEAWKAASAAMAAPVAKAS